MSKKSNDAGTISIDNYLGDGSASEDGAKKDDAFAGAVPVSSADDEKRDSAEEFAKSGKGDLGDVDDEDDTSDTDDDSDDSADSDDADGGAASKEAADKGKASDDKTFIVFSDGDKKLKIPANAVITVPVNGKNVEYKASDVQQALNLHDYNQRQRSQIDKDKQALQVEKNEHSDALKTMHEALELIAKGDQFGGLLALISMAKDDAADPGLLLKGYIKQAGKAIKNLEKYTPEKIDALIDRRSSEWKQKKIKDREAHLERAEKDIKFKDTFATKLTEAGVTQEQFDKAEREIREALDVDLDKMQPEQRADYILQQAIDVDIPFDRFVTLALSKYSEQALDTMLKNDKKITAILAVAKNADDEELLAAIEAIFKQKPDKESTSKAENRESTPAKAGKSKSASSKANGAASSKQAQDAFLSMDDLIASLEE